MAEIKARSYITSIQAYTYFKNGVYASPTVKFKDQSKIPFDWDRAELASGMSGVDSREVYEKDIISCVIHNVQTRGRVERKNGTFVVLGVIPVSKPDGSVVKMPTEALKDCTLASCKEVKVMGNANRNPEGNKVLVEEYNKAVTQYNQNQSEEKTMSKMNAYAITDDNGVVHTGSKADMREALEALTAPRSTLEAKYGEDEAQNLIDKWTNVETNGELKMSEIAPTN